MRKLWTIRWFRVLLGVVLTAALLAPVVLPALQMQRQEPENPIRKENIQPVRRLSFGDGDGGTLAAAPLTQETGTGGSQSGQEQNPEQPPEEQTGENVPEQLPEQPQSDPEPQPGQESGEQPGERTDGQPDDAGDETQPDALDLGLVLTWYRYGGERYRSLCPSDTTVRQDVRTAQLPDGKLRYELELRGLDAVDSQITNVEISENNGAFAPADERGSIAMQVARRARTATIRSACRQSARTCWRTEHGRSRRRNSASCWSIPTSLIWKRSCYGRLQAAVRPACAASPEAGPRARSETTSWKKIFCATASVWAGRAPRMQSSFPLHTAPQTDRAGCWTQMAARSRCKAARTGKTPIPFPCLPR